jgi:hypothetical protein
MGIAGFFFCKFCQFLTLTPLLTFRPRHTTDELWCRLTIDISGARLRGSEKRNGEQS